MSVHAPNIITQLPSSPSDGCYTDLEDFAHFCRSLHAVLGTGNQTFSTSRHPQEWWLYGVGGCWGAGDGRGMVLSPQQPLSPLCVSPGFGLLPSLVAGMLLTSAAASHIWEPRVEQWDRRWKFGLSPTGLPVPAPHLVQGLHKPHPAPLSVLGAPQATHIWTGSAILWAMVGEGDTELNWCQAGPAWAGGHSLPTPPVRATFLP